MDVGVFAGLQSLPAGLAQSPTAGAALATRSFTAGLPPSRWCPHHLPNKPPAGNPVSGLPLREAHPRRGLSPFRPPSTCAWDEWPFPPGSLFTCLVGLRVPQDSLSRHHLPLSPLRLFTRQRSDAVPALVLQSGHSSGSLMLHA